MEKNRFGELVRQAREDRGIKAFELADLMHMHGSQISRLENGTFKETPAPDVLEQLHEHLGLPQRELLAALGYFADESAPNADERDPLKDRLHAAVDAVDWRRATKMAQTLLDIMAAQRYDQTDHRAAPNTPLDPTMRPTTNSERGR